MRINYEDEKEGILETHQKTFSSCNVLTATVGTTGPKGGDFGHGSRVFVKFDDSSASFFVKVNGQIFETDEFEFLTGGDSELATLKEAFNFISKHM
jgi:hypothetical protein